MRKDTSISRFKPKLPIVSVIIPTFNRSKLLALTIQAVLMQDYPKDRYEIIIVDDGSNDGTKGLVDRFRKKHGSISYYFQENLGYRAGQTRNLGAAHAKGDTLVFLDDAVIAHPQLIQSYARSLVKYNCVLGYVASYNTSNKYNLREIQKAVKLKNIAALKVIKEFRDNVFADQRKNNSKYNKNLWQIFVTANFAIKRSLFLKYKFDESFVGWGAEDEEFGYRLIKDGHTVKLDKRCMAFHMPHKDGGISVGIYTSKKVDSFITNQIKFYNLYLDNNIKENILRRYSGIPNKFRNNDREQLLKLKLQKSVLVVLADKNYIDMAKQVFASAYYNGNWEGRFMLLTNNIPERSLKEFRNKGIIIKKARAVCRKPINHYLPTVFLKFEIFREEFKEWDRVVFVDGDTIIKAPLDDLLDVCGFWAVRDCGLGKFSSQFKSTCDRKNVNERLLFQRVAQNYDLSTDSFNVGLMAFSTDIIRKDTYDNLVCLYKRYKSIIRFPEQAILNLYFYRQVNYLPSVYNGYVNLVGLCCNKKIANNFEAIILHFSGNFPSSKPWNKRDRYYSEWCKNLAKFNDVKIRPILRLKKWSAARIECKSHISDRLNQITADKFSFVSKHDGLRYVKDEYNTGLVLANQKIKKASRFEPTRL